jgi:hypothetical protein
VGTSKSTAEFSGKLGRMASDLARLETTTAHQNAQTAEEVIGRAVSSMSGGDDRLSGAGPVGVSTAVIGGQVAVSPRGPVVLVENPTVPHVIGAGGTRLRIGSRWVTGPVFHRGTRGKGEWARARDNQLPRRVSDDTAKAMTDTARRVFG